MSHITRLEAMRRFYQSGGTQAYAFRKRQLQSFKNTLMRYEKEIYDALYTDLKKVPEECWFTENGLLLQEINFHLKHLKSWMKRVRVRTNLVNFPSSSYLYPSPLGMALIIGPWNFPVQLLLIPVVGAIAAGNCVLIKPSELAPATAGIVQKIISESFPPELAFVVQGDGAVVVPELMNSFRFDHVFYTGSIAVGKAVYQQAAKDLVPVTLELGGKAPCVVEKDASLKVAARRIVLGKFSNAGQMCVSPDYLLLHTDVKEQMLEYIKYYIHKFFGDQPSDTYGYNRIINAKRFDRLTGFLPEGNILYGGAHDRNQLYIQPTILDAVSPESPLMKEEIFGPLLPVFTFSSKEEALSIIERNPQPLSFYVFSSNPKKRKDWILSFRFGNGCVNNTAMQFTNHHLPFGGTGQSGIGSYHGKKSFEVFTHYKQVLQTPSWFDPALKYPPLKGKMRLLKFLIR